MSASTIRARLHELADRVIDDFDAPGIAPTLDSTRKAIDALEKVIGYCDDKLNPTPLKDRASAGRLESRAERAKVRNKPAPDATE